MKSSARPFRTLAMACVLAAFGANVTTAQPKMIAGSPCSSPPRINCPESNCPPDLVGNQGAAIEAKTGRWFFLDYPCDLKPNEKVVFILSLHGAGSIGNWQRHYFPVVDLKEKYRLVIATPTAKTATPMRAWNGPADDEYLHNIVDLVYASFGKQNIKSFWLAGHSQGGMTSRRIVCTDYFKDKVDGWLSLSGGRIGSPPAPPRPAPAAPAAGAPPAAGATPAPVRAAAPPPAPLDCEFSFIYDTGQLEATGMAMPTTSTWAEKYKCAPRERRADIVDSKPGYVTATDQTRGPAWGRFARGGTTQEFVYPKCADGRVVADFVRMDKGHTEGLEPNVMDEIVKLMVSAKGGKAQGRS
jgi:hypothetical protein